MNFEMRVRGTELPIYIDRIVYPVETSVRSDRDLARYPFVLAHSSPVITCDIKHINYSDEPLLPRSIKHLRASTTYVPVLMQAKRVDIMHRARRASVDFVFISYCAISQLLSNLTTMGRERYPADDKNHIQQSICGNIVHHLKNLGVIFK